MHSSLRHDLHCNQAALLVRDTECEHSDSICRDVIAQDIRVYGKSDPPS